MEDWLLPLHTAAEGLGAPALASADALDVFRLARQRQQYVERLSLRRRRIFSKHYLIVTVPVY